MLLLNNSVHISSISASLLGGFLIIDVPKKLKVATITANIFLWTGSSSNKLDDTKGASHNSKHIPENGAPKINPWTCAAMNECDMIGVATKSHANESNKKLRIQILMSLRRLDREWTE